MDMCYNPLFPLSDDMECMPDAQQDGSPDDNRMNNGNRSMEYGSGGDAGDLSEMMPMQDSIAPDLLSLAMGYVPRQTWETPYELDVGLSRGTIFPGLDKPLLMEPTLSPQPRERMGDWK